MSSIAAASITDPAGTTTYLNGLWAAIANGGVGPMIDSSSAYMEQFQLGDGDMTNTNVLEIGSPSIASAPKVGKLIHPRAIRIQNQSAKSGGSLADRIEGAFGLWIATFTDPIVTAPDDGGDIGIDNGAPTVLRTDQIWMPDLAEESGTVYPVCVNGDGRIYIATDGTCN
jgi:hypothetical protein